MASTRLTLTLAALLGFASTPSSLLAQCSSSPRFETFRIDSAPGEGIGNGRVRISGNVIVTGAVGPEVVIFRFDGEQWAEEQRVVGIVPWDVSADRIIGRSGTEQRAFVFAFDGTQWSLEDELEKPVPTDTNYAREARISGSRALVSSTQAVHAFEHDGNSWQYCESFPGPWTDFDLDGDLAVLGDEYYAPLPGPNDCYSGKVELLRHDGVEWQVIGELVGELDDSQFGSAVALGGHGLVAGNNFLGGGPATHHWAFLYDEGTGSWAPADDRSPAGEGATNGTIFFNGPGGCARKIDSPTSVVPRHELDISDFPFSVGCTIDMDGDIVAISHSDRYQSSYLPRIYIYHGIGKTPQVGTVDLASGTPADVLFVNGSAGVAGRVVTVPVRTSISVELLSPPLGPVLAEYLLFGWRGGLPDVAYPVGTGDETIGWFRTLPPFLLGTTVGSAPIRCVRSAAFSFADCGGVSELGMSPASTPFLVRKRSGLAQPGSFSLQAIVEDNGADNGLGLSASNAILLNIVP